MKTRQPRTKPAYTYTKKVEGLLYEVQGICPTIDQMVDTTKANELMRDIEQANISDGVKKFLRLAATRHIKFNYKNIAEFYAGATPEVQELMEKSALVVIDINDAIKYGFTRFSQKLEELCGHHDDQELVLPKRGQTDE